MAGFAIMPCGVLLSTYITISVDTAALLRAILVLRGDLQHSGSYKKMAKPGTRNSSAGFPRYRLTRNSAHQHVQRRKNTHATERVSSLKFIIVL